MTTIEPPGPFSLAASAGFAELAPNGRTGEGEGLDLAFAVEGGWRTVGVRVEQPGGADHPVTVDVVANAGRVRTATVVDQVVRMLSLDVDGEPFADVGERDPVVGTLQRRYPGLRPVQFHSAYEAAAWTLIGHRIRMTQASAVRVRLAQELGEQVEVGGRTLSAFPAPERLARLEPQPGLTDVKVERLRALGRAAAGGLLDGTALRALPPDEALARLKELPGIGPFSAELTLVRGAGHPDVLPLHEARFSRAVGDLYDLGHPATDADLDVVSQSWRPYRSWVAVLIRWSVEERPAG